MLVSLPAPSRLPPGSLPAPEPFVTALPFRLGLAAFAAGSLESHESSRTEPVTGLRDNGTGDPAWWARASSPPPARS